MADRNYQVSIGTPHTPCYTRCALPRTILLVREWKKYMGYTNTTKAQNSKIEVMRVYANQTELGWQHFVRGRLVIKWGNMINDHISTQQRYTFNAEHWGSKLLLSINWKYIRSMGSTKLGSARRHTRQGRDDPTTINDR
jgi:hypothetical protein